MGPRAWIDHHKSAYLLGIDEAGVLQQRTGGLKTYEGGVPYGACAEQAGELLRQLIPVPMLDRLRLQKQRAGVWAQGLKQPPRIALVARAIIKEHIRPAAAALLLKYDLRFQ